jgi:phospholipid/cholesterol/gamma-HCH transport system permease protein
MSTIQSLGKFVIERARSYSQLATILWHIVPSIITLSFLNSAVFLVLVRQVYFTAVQVLPLILISSFIIGSITVHYILEILTDLVGAYDLVGTWLISSILHEIAPIICTLILLLRSGVAIVVELSLMKINKEIETLQYLDIDLHRYLYLPRILAFVVAGPSLTIVFSIVSLVGSFIIFGFRYNITFDSYMGQLYDALTLSSIFIVLTKPVVMSAAVALISIQKGMVVEKATEVPVKLIQGMIQAVGIIIAIEIIYSLI